MINNHICRGLDALVAAHRSRTRRPVRPAEQPRSVTLTLAEYNRLLDLERRAPVAPPVAPVAAIVSSADLKVTDRSRQRSRCLHAQRPGAPHRRWRAYRWSMARITAGRHVRRTAGPAGHRRPDAAGADQRTRARSRFAPTGAARWSFRPDARRSSCRCRRPARRGPRSISRASKPMSESRPA